MATKRDYAYKPDYAVLPGDTLREALDSLSMTQRDLASRMGRPLKTINEIIKGKASITPDSALQLERILGIPASFWLNLERNYREVLARRKDEDRLRTEVAWIRQFPLRAMAKAGWVRSYKSKLEQAQELLQFFGVATPEQWRGLWTDVGVAYRKSAVFKSDPGAVAAWLRKGELEAQRLQCQAYDPERFRTALAEVRGLTLRPPDVFQPEVTRLCAEAGVAVVFVPELPKLCISGASRWLSPTKGLIQLSLRYKSDDHLWFSFFHEAAHLLLHGKRRIFIDDDTGKDGLEAEANTFAANFLIPPPAFKRLMKSTPVTEAAILRVAKEIGVAPGIIVGRLQHESLLQFSECNHLKKRFEWVSPTRRRAAA